MIHSMISAVLHVAAGSSAQRFPSSDALKKRLITAQDSKSELLLAVCEVKISGKPRAPA
jgi:hypothetical protein